MASNVPENQGARQPQWPYFDRTDQKCITIGGALNRQQYEVSLGVIADVKAEFIVKSNNNSWENFNATFAQHQTKGDLDEGLRSQDICLERIIGDSSINCVLQFRVRNRDHLRVLKREIILKSLAPIILRYMTRREEPLHLDLAMEVELTYPGMKLELSYDLQHFDKLKRKLDEIGIKRSKLFDDYLKMQKGVLNLDNNEEDGRAPPNGAGAQQ